MVQYLLNHTVDIMAILWVLDQIAALTPETWKIGNFPIGKYDNIIVSGLKDIMKNLGEKKILK